MIEIDGPLWFAGALFICGAHVLYLRSWRREQRQYEVHRVLSKPLREFTERNANKNAAGFLIEASRKNACCGNSGTHSEGGREYCSTCGQEIA